MTRDIDLLTATLQRAHPGLTVAQLQVRHPGDDDGLWFIRHPDAVSEVQVESPTGNAPFLVESDLAPPVTAPTLAATLQVVGEQLGFTVGGG